MPLDAAELARLRAVVAPVQDRLLSLVDARPKQPGFVPGSELTALYHRTFGEELDPVALTGQTDLKSLLNRRNIFPSLGVRGSDKKGGWLIYRVATPAVTDGGASCPPALQRFEDNVIELLRRAANPTEPGEKPRYSLDAGKLANRYGEQLKCRFNWRDFGFSSLRALLEACPRLDVIMQSKEKGGSNKDKMRVIVRGEAGAKQRAAEAEESTSTATAAAHASEASEAAQAAQAAQAARVSEAEEIIRAEKAAEKAEKAARKAEKAAKKEAKAAKKAADDAGGGGGGVVVPYLTDAGEFLAALDASKRSGRALVLDFTATWCGPCQAIGPAFVAMAGEFPTITFAKVDVDAAEDVAEMCRVSAMPTFQVYRGGDKVDELCGAEEGKLRAVVAKHAAPATEKRKRDEAAADETASCAEGDEAAAKAAKKAAKKAKRAAEAGLTEAQAEAAGEAAKAARKAKKAAGKEKKAAWLAGHT